MTNIEAASSSSASFTGPWKYHVFLSFRGEDTRYNFTGHLCNALRNRGIRTFMDDDLTRGEEISMALLKAIEESKISIIVFSSNYASSKWCLDELVKILECKKSNKQIVVPIFYKVDPSDIRNQRGSYGNALTNHECRYKDNTGKVKTWIEAAANLVGWNPWNRYKDGIEKVEKWRAALSEAAHLSGWTLNEHESESELIRNIVEKTSVHAINRKYLYVANYPIGIKPRVQVINQLLVVGGDDVRMVGIWGPGGIGKTTIAKAVYNSIVHKFEGSCFLRDVREKSFSGLAELQSTLLFEILGGSKKTMSNEDHGITMIKELLGRKRVLLVLDDVNNMKQLHYLAGSANWFGMGSRVIVTTRDKKLLTAHDANSIYKVEAFNDHEARELFSLNAFKKITPLDNYVELSERAIRCAQGLPLVLGVLGSGLHGESTDKWQAALDGLVKGQELHDIFKISYNALDDGVKKVFLDIACFCFYKVERRNYLMEILESCNLNPRYGIDVLIDKALINIEGNCIQMHDLLKEMGKKIVHEESPTEPGERSRIWFYKDVEHVLTKNTGTNKITCIMVNFPNRDAEICLNLESFSEMKNLKIFINYNAFLSGDIGCLPDELRVLHWCRYPSQSLPANFHPKDLVLFNMDYGRIRQLSMLEKHFAKLTSLRCSRCSFLTEIPDLSTIPNLKYLIASSCRNLVEVHPSVGYLDKLEELDFGHCPLLAKFPKKVSLKSLKRLDLGGCKKIESCPEIVGKMESTYSLVLSSTAIKELPSSIGHLTALEYIFLIKCKNLTNLPQSIYGLQHLRRLCLRGCPKLVSLPNILKSEVLPSAESLPWEVLTNSNVSHDNIGSSAFPNFSDIHSPANFGCSTELLRINLSFSNFVSLPACISKFVNLKKLNLSGCKRLREIPELLPPELTSIVVADCISLERFSTLSKILEDGDMEQINKMDLLNCHRLCDNLGLDASKMAKILLKQTEYFSKGYRVVVPGSEVPAWFSCRKDVDFLINADRVEEESEGGRHDFSAEHAVCELVIEFPRSFKWENTGILICTVSASTGEDINWYKFGTRFTIDGVLLLDATDYWFPPPKAEYSRVRLVYMPLPLDLIREVDRESDQLMPYTCRVVFYLRGEGGMLFKSCGVHVAHISDDDDDDDEVVGSEDLEDEELDDDHNYGDDLGDEIRPRKRKKI